jgi:hypothetical protein
LKGCSVDGAVIVPPNARLEKGVHVAFFVIESVARGGIVLFCPFGGVMWTILSAQQTT